MPQFIKHVGQVDSTSKKCVVVFREIPGENNSCLVVETESLPQLYHDDLMTAVESDSAQAEADFSNYASRSSFHDGRNMLEGMHLSGWLKKLSTQDVTMLPTREISIGLADLNQQMAALANEGKTTSSDISDPTPIAEIKSLDTLSDEQIANQMRSQATYFQKEAQRLLAEADSLSPNNISSNVPTTSTPKRKYTKKK